MHYYTTHSSVHTHTHTHTHTHCIYTHTHTLYTYTGRQFIAAEDLLFSARHPSYWESLDAAVNCFMLAIEVSLNVTKCVVSLVLYKFLFPPQAHVKQKNDVMAAMYCLEIAHRLKVL